MKRPLYKYSKNNFLYIYTLTLRKRHTIDMWLIKLKLCNSDLYSRILFVNLSNGNSDEIIVYEDN